MKYFLLDNYYLNQMDKLFWDHDIFHKQSLFDYTLHIGKRVLGQSLYCVQEIQTRYQNRSLVDPGKKKSELILNIRLPF